MLNFIAFLVWLLCLGIDIHRAGAGISPTWSDVFVPEGLLVFVFFMDWIKGVIKND